MKHATTALMAGLVTAASFGMGGLAQAQTFVEPADAGQTITTAQSTAPTLAAVGTPLTTITGNFSSGTDADLYIIDISAPTTFSATTFNTATDMSGLDTALSLFDSSGNAVATNDDTNGTTFDATLPAGNALYATLLPGVYYLGIAQSGNEAINSSGQSLFVGYPGGDTTAIRGAASGLNPTQEADFNGSTFDGDLGAYQIDLTSTTAVPEPSTWAAVILGAVTLGGCLRLRRRAV